MKSKVGLMGCGTVAGYGHIPAILEVPDLELVALYDPTESRLQAMQERYAIPHAFSNLDDFFASGIEAVTITSPAPCHRDNVIDCARHQLPVLCEKPLAMDRAEGEEMVAAMRAAGLTLYTGFCYRFSPSALKIRELVRAGAIGAVRSLRLIYNWSMAGKYMEVPGGGKRIHQRREARMLEGGHMVDCGTHQIDLAQFWLGSPVVRYAGQGAWVDEFEAPDHMWLHLDHANGAHTMVEMSYSYTHTSARKCSLFTYELIGTEGILRYDRDSKSFTMENGAGHHDFPWHPEKEFRGMYREWARALRSGKSDLLTSGEEGIRVADIARSATESVIRDRL
ncbi:Gfo/Idh/MocA family protein [Puniceicoccus vermicola]|uniref:Gfo/Idh/MocA family oxidoreductase n=1 Tax=Puniceicoccus vermicola TaxID=388746 RepID=A0A7X1B081_9BACT|nr:Gfo/Idh/MocA family oxidoreductase [Puniceicoccus vermicola]MBC2603211.1 Gfo/Idh/MocA family oxidoreductase [Puniceicoccus vermicola]